ncbi:permease [Limnospira fusiformis CCALA 023]|uniref:sulfite exporter TauE/SafE family protein n=1 Tax=Arthrospira sp. PCC 8006 TaxID=1982224 RepID=UPI0012C812E0|nr:sulfite exporter TauE/SafE family protein [Arthrospira sp. PLM2.Bin9]TVU52949.1 MAG: sulfite exporter TauE/SafE family protein [Arthrospira sp. PLM2.Bin9]
MILEFLSLSPTELLTLAIAGLFAGILAGFLGIGGGTVLVPILVTLGYVSNQAVATSIFSVLITAISGSIQNWRMGFLRVKRVILIGFPAVITAIIGSYLANLLPSSWLLFGFGCLLLLNIYLIKVRQDIIAKKQLDEQLNSTSPQPPKTMNPYLAFMITGSLAGLLAGLFGVGGGVIIVPLQILLLGETIKVSIQTSLGVIIITAASACIGHAIQGNVLWIQGMMLGLGGLVGVQISTRFLPKLPDRIVTLAFRTLLGILSIYMFWRASL